MNETPETNESNIGQLVRKLETNYISGITTSSKYVQKSMKDDLDMIDAYVNSKFTTGPKDSQDREKPFFNVGTAARNIWYRATDINRKDIIIRAKKIKNVIATFLATQKIQEYMEKDYWGAFLNKWGLTLATYGSAVLKFVVKEGKLHSSVVPWNTLIVDPINFDNNVVIEVLEFTEAQLRQNPAYDQDMVEKLCDARKQRTTIAGDVKDQKSEYIKLYEVHGMLPLSYLTGNDEDDDTYVQQMHVITFLASKEKGKFDDYTLVSGKEENPYMITHLIEVEGQTLSIGAIQNLFEVQWMVNHSVKAVKDQLDLASKLIFQTSDGNFVGQNALSAIENGDILVHAINQPITSIANTSHDITALQNQLTTWKQLGNEINGISESMMGINPPSHTAWRQTQAVLQESYSLFELMKQNKKLYVEEMLRRFIIPYIKKYQLNNADEVASTLSSYDLNRIDAMYITSEVTNAVNKEIVAKALAFAQGKGPAPTPEEQMMLTQQAEYSMKNNMQPLGGTRFFKPDQINWKEELKDIEWEPEIVIEGENEDTQAALTTLDTLLKTLVSMQGRPMTPEEKLVTNKILMKAGQVNPAELSAVASMPQPQLPAPQQPAPAM